MKNANVIVKSGIQISLPGPLLIRLEIGPLTIVLLKYDSPGVSERNVLAFGADGHQLWQIESSPIRLRENERYPYTHIEVKDGRLHVDNWAGYDAFVSLTDGSVEPITKGRLS